MSRMGFWLSEALWH